MARRSGRFPVGLGITPWLAAPTVVAGCALALGIEDKEPWPANGDGGTIGAEICQNGVDDDGDGAIDCADPDCSASVCAPPIPAGWLGPVVLRLGDAEGSCDPGQAEAFVPGGTGVPDVPPADCEPCVCTLPAAGCAVEVAFQSLFLACQTPTVTVGPSAAGCFNLATAANARAAWVTSTQPRMPCAPSGGAERLPRPAISFDEWALACQGPPGGGCNADEICMPEPPGGFIGPCAYRTGDEECPGTAYTRRVEVHQVEDRRSCSPCTCPELPDCTRGLVELYAEADCAGDAGSAVPLDGGCAELPALEAVQSLRASAEGEHACTPEGGNGSTDVASTTITLCCTP